MQTVSKIKGNGFDLFVAAEIDKPKKIIYRKDLQPINNLKIIFREIRDYFAGNVTGITRDEKIAQNIMRLLFCKIYDEKNTPKEKIVEIANRPNEDLQIFYSRISSVFKQVKEKYPDIFEAEDEIEINPTDLSYIISKFEEYSILDADRDIIADAFEELIGRAFRGGEGQFFTPRNIVQMMIDILQPKPNEKIIDPACGSGGFLAHILQHFLRNGNGNHNLFGIDKDLFLSRLAKIYLTILGESEYHIFCENSLEQPKNWNKETQEQIQLGTFDLILTNPPFGAKIPVIGNDLLKQFELGHQWLNQGNRWILTKELRDKQPPQILFIERIIQLLKEGGRAGIVLPEGIFGNPSDRYIWEYIRKYASVIGIVSLSQETFQPSTHTKTSVLFIEKKKDSRKNIFMAIANSVGHNKNGKEIYKLNKDGSFLIDKNGNKILDDDTPDIAKNFTKFLNGKLEEESHLGFVVSTEEIRDNIYIPEHYSPEIKEMLNELNKSGKYKLVTIGELVDKGIIQIKRGNEINIAPSADEVIQPGDVFVVIGGTLIATIISTPYRYVIKTIKNIYLFTREGDENNPDKVIAYIIEVAENVRKNGFRAFREVDEKIADGFLKRVCDAVVEYSDMQFVKSIMEQEINNGYDEINEISNVYRTMAILSPMFGLVGTLIGIIGVLKEISNPEMVGPSMSIAITSAFYGIFLSNMIFTPIANKIRARAIIHLKFKGMVLEGVLEIMKGSLPVMIENLSRICDVRGNRRYGSEAGGWGKDRD